MQETSRHQQPPFDAQDERMNEGLMTAPEVTREAEAKFKQKFPN